MSRVAYQDHARPSIFERLAWMSHKAASGTIRSSASTRVKAARPIATPAQAPATRNRRSQTMMVKRMPDMPMNWVSISDAASPPK